MNPKRDEIIEFAALRVVGEKGLPVVADKLSILIELSPGRHLPEAITRLTGITEERLADEGIAKDKACNMISDMLMHPGCLLAAYNAQFDLGFLYHFLDSFDKAELLKGMKMLDVLTVYRDRKPYPHKLADAVNAYSIDIENFHCASDDARATFDLLCKMGAEEDDLAFYVNLFGYNPKYGVSGSKISSVKYLPQGYNMRGKLYEP